MPEFSNNCVEASELDTAPLNVFLIFASSSIKKLTVDPVPTPIIESRPIFGLIYSIASIDAFNFELLIMGIILK